MRNWSKALLILYLIVIADTVQAQNLVPNPSFESFSNCPTSSSQIYYADFWFQPNEINLSWQPPSGSSDYYNSCSGFIAGVPSNVIGFQYALTGNAYGGIAFINNPGGGWEYIEVGLITSMNAQKKYCGGYYVSRAELARNACNRQGAYFDTDSVFYYSNNYGPLIKNPQIENQIVISDTGSWVLIKGAFISNGGERFMVIGNFRDLSSTTVDTISSTGFNTSYYYIDDVFVEEMQIDTANTGADVTICEGDSAQLGTATGSGCIYRWQPATGLSDTTIAQPIAKPTQTTTYILIVDDTSTGTKCDWTSTDSVTVTVIPFTPQMADAGTDVTLCKGESATLGTTPCGSCTYQWQPLSNLNNSTTAQPVASPTQTTTYILTMTDSFPPCVKTTTDAVNVFVEDCTVEVYDIFTPNSDGKNDVFFIKNLPANSSLQVFNRWGSRIYQSSNYNNQWSGDDVPDGTYYYILVLPTEESFHGFVEIRR